MKLAPRVLNALLISLLTLSCTKTSPTKIEAVDAPSFRAMPEVKVRTSMWDMAFFQTKLEEVLGPRKPGYVDRQREVLDILQSMKDTAKLLENSEEGSQHPLIGTRLDLLQEDIDNAMEATKETPPNYFYAGILSGSCRYCHASRISPQ